MRCIEAATGVVKWSEQRTGVAHTTLVGDQLLVFGIDGTLRLVEATPSKYQESAIADISSNVTRALPALSNGRFYFRDNAANVGTLTCVQLAQ